MYNSACSFRHFITLTTLDGEGLVSLSQSRTSTEIGLIVAMPLFLVDVAESSLAPTRIERVTPFFGGRGSPSGKSEKARYPRGL